ncbi:MAG TPA: TolC family protein [Flavisolibacter sp.]
MKKGIISLILVTGVLTLRAQQKYELTVQEAVDLAYRNVMELRNAQVDYRIQEAKNKEITGMAYPQLSASFSASHYLELPAILFPDATSTAVYQILKDEGVSGSSGPITSVPAPQMRQVSFQQPWNMALGATVTQLLFQPDVFVGLQARETALNLSQSMVDQVRDRIKDSAYKRYYAILVAEKQLHYVDEGLARLNKLYRDDSIMYRNGFAEKLDLDRVQVQINNLRTTRNTIANAVNLAYAAMKFALGVSQKDTIVLKDNLSPDMIRDNLLDPTFSYEDRTEIRTLTFARKLQELDLKRYRLGYIPTVSAIGNYSLNGMGQKFFTNPNTIWINSAYIGLSVNVPLFDGFQRKYKVRQAQLNIEKVDNTISTVKQGIDLEQVATKGLLVNAINNLDIQEANMQLAEKVYNTTKIKFEQGLGSSFEVLQSDADLQQAQANYFTALYNAMVARVSYLHSLGKL